MELGEAVVVLNVFSGVAEERKGLRGLRGSEEQVGRAPGEDVLWPYPREGDRVVRSLGS